METNKENRFDVEGFAKAVLSDLQTGLAPAEGQRPFSNILHHLEKAVGDVRAEHAQSVKSLDERYRTRIESMQQALTQRQTRFEAYAKRSRQTVPTEPDVFIVAGRVLDQETNEGLPYARVHVKDLDDGERVLEARTDALGYFRIDYREPAKKGAKLQVEVRDEEGEVIYTSKELAGTLGQSEFVSATVEGARLPSSRRIAEKVTQTVSARSDDLARQVRSLEHGTMLRLEPVGHLDRTTPIRPPLPAELPKIRQDVPGEGSGAKSSGAKPDSAKAGGAKESGAKAGGAKERGAKAGGAKPDRAKPGDAKASDAKASDAKAGGAQPGRAKAREKVAAAKLTEVRGIGQAYAGRLEKAGIRDVKALASRSASDVDSILNVGKERAATIIREARRLSGRS